MPMSPFCGTLHCMHSHGLQTSSTYLGTCAIISLAPLIPLMDILPYPKTYLGHPVHPLPISYTRVPQEDIQTQHGHTWILSKHLYTCCMDTQGLLPHPETSQRPPRTVCTTLPCGHQHPNSPSRKFTQLTLVVYLRHLFVRKTFKKSTFL